MSFLVPDFETKLLHDLRPSLLANPVELDKLDAHIRARAEMVRAGVRRVPTWFMEDLLLLDSRLRAWWDSFTEEWVIDRLQDAGVAEMLERLEEEGFVPPGEATGLLARGAYYLTVLHFKPTPKLQLNRQLIEFLRSCDTQRVGPETWLADKRAQAQKVREANEQKATEKVLAAVDRMSSKQIKEFIAVEEALASGETIIPGGNDAKFLERADEAYKRACKEAEDRGDDPRTVRTMHHDADHALNPGMRPQIYKRGSEE